ncbi:hypothetical protein [Parendozoicomonas sp. Alg238-R29]|uniref:hypothetical protein n=1 Tax=Parendozoicomonas sp. Alg238-R29 TaxID=2993446 RepID=UPI00248E3D54|nr:hypothetical protein [Parendozoicomonas sp. Alg238-R29]
MHCLKFPFGCLLALFSLGPTGAYGSEEKPLSPLSSSAAKYEMKDERSSGQTDLAIVGADADSVQHLPLKRPRDLLEDCSDVAGAGAGADEIDASIEAVNFSDLVDTPPVILLSPEDEKCKFSIPWGSSGARITVHSWDKDKREYVMESLPQGELAPTISFTEGEKTTLNGTFSTAALNKSNSWMFRVIVANNNPMEGLFLRMFHVVVLDHNKVNSVTLLDANAIGEDGSGAELKEYENNFSSLQVNDVVILAADPAKPYFRSQLPGALVMTKKAVADKSQLLESITKLGVEEKKTREQESMQKKWDELVEKLTAFKGETSEEEDEGDFGVPELLKKTFSLAKKDTSYVKGADDVLMDTDTFQLQLGPVKTTTETHQGIIIEPWGHQGSDVAGNVWVPVHPLGKTLTPVLSGQHFPYSEINAYKVKWIRDAAQFAVSHVVIMTPAVLGKPLTIIDLTQKRRTRHTDSTEAWLRGLTGELEPGGSTVVVVGSTADAVHVRKHFKDATSVFFPDSDDDRLTYLNLAIKKFTGGRKIYRRHADSELFREQSLELEEVKFSPLADRGSSKRPRRDKGRVTPTVQPSDS